MSTINVRSLDDGFSGSVPQTAADVEVALTTGLLSLDANVLLGFYRYSAKARDALVEVLTAAGDRVWVSHQAAREFWRNRTAAIDDRNSATEELISSLEKQERSASEAVATWAKKTAIPEDVKREVAEKVAASFVALRELVERESEEESGVVSYDAAKDSVIDTLRRILKDRVGSALSAVEREEALKEAGRRVKDQRPPGFLDADKESGSGPDGAAGDYLVWLQSMNEAKRRELPLVIVTGDEKTDWWWKHRSRFMGPRAELVDECRETVGQALYMLRPIELIENASVLNVEVTQEAASDLARATSDVAARWTRVAVHELLSRLDSEGAVQADVIRRAAEEGGIIDRADIYEIGGYDEDRMLRGFTRPPARVTRELQAEGLLDDGVEAMLTPIYHSGVIAEQFEIPLDVVEILSSEATSP